MSDRLSAILERYAECRELLYVNRKLAVAETSAEADMEWLMEQVTVLRAKIQQLEALPEPGATALTLAREENEQLRGDLERLSEHYQKLMAECDEKDAKIKRLLAVADEWSRKYRGSEAAKSKGDRHSVSEPLRVEWPCPIDANCECQCHNPEWSGSFREVCACRSHR